MPLVFWFWLSFFLAVLGTVAGGWPANASRPWIWGVPLVLILLMLAILALKVFGGPVTG